MAVYDFDFKFQKILYVDPVLDIEILLCGKGNFRASADQEIISEDKLISKVESILPIVFCCWAVEGFGYDSIYRDNDKVLSRVRRLLDEESELHGKLKIENVSIMELYPADEDIPKIIEAKKRKPQLTDTVPMSDQSIEPPAGQTNTWTCRTCGKPARGKFCPSCGAAFS